MWFVWDDDDDCVRNVCNHLENFFFFFAQDENGHLPRAFVLFYFQLSLFKIQIVIFSWFTSFYLCKKRLVMEGFGVCLNLIKKQTYGEMKYWESYRISTYLIAAVPNVCGLAAQWGEGERGTSPAAGQYTRMCAAQLVWAADQRAHACACSLTCASWTAHTCAHKPAHCSRGLVVNRPQPGGLGPYINLSSNFKLFKHHNLTLWYKLISVLP